MTGSLATELADGALVFARSPHYTLVDRPRVDLLADTTVERTDIRVVARFADPIAGRERRDLPPDLEADDASDGDAGARLRLCRRPWQRPHRHDGLHGPPAQRPAARLRVTPPDGAEFLCDFDGTSLTIGRGRRQRPGPRRRPGVAPPRSADRPARHARVPRSRQHQRLAGQRRAGRRARPRGGRPDRARRHGHRRRGDRGRGLMDAFLLVIWIVRLLFLALLYVFLSRIVGTLLRDLRAAAREPGTSPGRLVVVESPGRRAGGRPVVRPRRDHDPRARRQQRDRDRRPVRLGGARRADVSRPELVRRGPRQHERDVRNGRAVSGVSPLGFGDEVAIGQVRLRLERPAARDGGERSRARAPRLPRDPRADPAAATLDGGPSAGPRGPRAGRRQRVAASRPSTGEFGLADAAGLGIYLGALGLAHLAQVLAGRRSDQVLLPVVGMLGGISLLLMQRLPQDLVTLARASRPSASARSSWSGWSSGSPSRRRSRSSSARTRGCAATSTRGRRSASPCCS